MASKKLSKTTRNKKDESQQNKSHKSQLIIPYHKSGLELQDEAKHFTEVLAFIKNRDNISALKKFIRDCQDANPALPEDMKKALSDLGEDTYLEPTELRLRLHGWEIGFARIDWEMVRFIIAAERLISDAKANFMSINQWMQLASEDWKQTWIAGLDFHVGFIMQHLNEWLNSSIRNLNHVANFKSSIFMSENYFLINLLVTNDDIANEIRVNEHKKTKKTLNIKENRGGKRVASKWTQEQINKFVTTVDNLPKIQHNKRGKTVWEYAIDVFEEYDYGQRGIDVILNSPEFTDVKELVVQCNKARASFREKGKIPEAHHPKAYNFRHAMLILKFPEVSYSTMKRYYNNAKKL